MKYGLRMEKPDIISPLAIAYLLPHEAALYSWLSFLVLHNLHGLRMNLLPRLKTAAVTDDHLFARAQPGNDLGIGGRLYPNVTGAVLDFAVTASRRNTVVLSPS